jgi:hypothetical protein
MIFLTGGKQAGKVAEEDEAVRKIGLYKQLDFCKSVCYDFVVSLFVKIQLLTQIKLLCLK